MTLSNIFGIFINALSKFKFKNANIKNKKDEGKIIDDIWDGINTSSRLVSYSINTYC